MRDFQVGEQVTWMHQPRGGYGYVMPTPARIVRFSPRGRPVIEVTMVSGEVVTRCVLTESLRHAPGVVVAPTEQKGGA